VTMCNHLASEDISLHSNCHAIGHVRNEQCIVPITNLEVTVTIWTARQAAYLVRVDVYVERMCVSACDLQLVNSSNLEGPYGWPIVLVISICMDCFISHTGTSTIPGDKPVATSQVQSARVVIRDCFGRQVNQVARPLDCSGWQRDHLAVCRLSDRQRHDIHIDRVCSRTVRRCAAISRPSLLNPARARGTQTSATT